MSNPTVAYASFCCAKDRGRALENFKKHADSHNYPFSEKLLVFQRCRDPQRILDKETQQRVVDAETEEKEKEQIKGFKTIEIEDGDYSHILRAYGIKYPDPVLDELTHGWSAPHFWAHHMVNHLAALHHFTAGNPAPDYIVFADGDCHMKEQHADMPSWVEVGIKTLEENPSMFVVSPSDGRPDGGPDRMMSQQMFLVNRKRFLEMDFIPWDGKFIEGGPFQEFYGLLEGWIYRHMVKHNLYRYVLPPQWRWWHKEWH